MPKKETRVQEIKRLCSEKNISVSEILRKANVSSVTLVNWEKEEPKSFRIYDAIIDAIEELSIKEENPVNHVNDVQVIE